MIYWRNSNGHDGCVDRQNSYKPIGQGNRWIWQGVDFRFSLLCWRAKRRTAGAKPRLILDGEQTAAFCIPALKLECQDRPTNQPY